MSTSPPVAPDPKPHSKRRASALEAVQCVRSGHRVFVHGGAATPTALLDALITHLGYLGRAESWS